MGVQSFFVMDENFLLNRPRAMQLLTRMKQADKSWALYVFSSVNAIRKYSMEELVQLGISWIWVGLESPNSSYAKLKNSDTRALAAELRQHGIKLLGSTIVGLEHHTPENIQDEIEYAVSHGTDFHQFMLYTPVPGTPLYLPDAARRPDARRTSTWPTFTGSSSLTSACRHIARRVEDSFSIGLSGTTSSVNGPSLVPHLPDNSSRDGSATTTIPRPASAARFAHEASKLRTTYNAALWAMEKRLRKRQTRRSRHEFAHCVARSKLPSDAHPTARAWPSARYCYGPRSAKTAVWLPA